MVKSMVQSIVDPEFPDAEQQRKIPTSELVKYLTIYNDTKELKILSIKLKIHTKYINCR